jgi:hypothetical protein
MSDEPSADIRSVTRVPTFSALPARFAYVFSMPFGSMPNDGAIATAPINVNFGIISSDLMLIIHVFLSAF